MGKAPIGISHELAVNRGALPKAREGAPVGQTAPAAPTGAMPTGSVLQGELLTSSGPTVRISAEAYRRSRLFSGVTVSISPVLAQARLEPHRGIEAYQAFGADESRGGRVDVFV